MSAHHSSSASAANVDARGRQAPSTSSSRRPPKLSSPNDVRVNPASNAVISNLLASLTTVAPDTEGPSPLVPDPPVPQSPIRFHSAGSSARPSISQRPSNLSSSRQYYTYYEPNPASPASEHFPEPPLPDVAEAPVVRTSRAPSGLSKVSAPSSYRRPRTPQAAPPTQPSTYAALSNFPSPPASARSSKSRLDVAIPPIPKISTERLLKRPGFLSSRKGSATEETAKPRGLSSQRDSLQLLRSKEARGKEKERLFISGDPEDVAERANESTSSLPPPISRYRHFVPRAAQTSAPSRVTSPPRSIIAALDELDDSAPGPSVPSRPAYSPDEYVVLHKQSQDMRPTRRDSKGLVPSRASSLRNTSASPPRMHFLSRRSSRQSHRSPETVLEEPGANDAITAKGFWRDQGDPLQAQAGASPPLSPRSPFMPVSLDDDNDVMRRIKELRAAKQEREREMQSALPVFDSGSLTPPPIPLSRPPDPISATFEAQESAAAAATAEDRMSKIRDEPPTRAAPAPPPSPATSAFSPLTADFKHRPSTAGPTSPWAPSSPSLSRSGSMSKRWSGQDYNGGPRRNSLHRRDNSRGQTGMYPPVPEERRASFDSVKESVADFLQSPRLSQKIRSPTDNRIISFSEVGDPQGYAVICCIGMGLTRYITAFYEELATSLKLRLITPERPGIGESSPYTEPRVPLYWPEDVRLICEHLSIRDFSLLGYSVGTIYALATALQMPDRVRGKIHLLAPWIPPSQMTNIGRSDAASARAGGLPRSQRFLRYVPTSFLKITHSSYFNGPRLNNSKSSNRSKKGDSNVNSPRPSTSSRAWNSTNTFVPLSATLSANPSGRPSTDRYATSLRPPMTPNLEEAVPVPFDHSFTADVLSAALRPSTATSRTAMTNKASHQKRYDEELTPKVWDLATKGGNPTVDLIVCLERNQPIGFRYADLAREVVIRHGTKDARIPLDNVKWLQKTMQRAQLMVLDGEGHSLMGNAGVMAQVLSDVSKEWEQEPGQSSYERFGRHSPVLEESEIFGV